MVKTGRKGGRLLFLSLVNSHLAEGRQWNKLLDRRHVEMSAMPVHYSAEQGLGRNASNSLAQPDFLLPQHIQYYGLKI